MNSGQIEVRKQDKSISLMRIPETYKATFLLHSIALRVWRHYFANYPGRRLGLNYIIICNAQFNMNRDFRISQTAKWDKQAYVNTSIAEHASIKLESRPRCAKS